MSEGWREARRRWRVLHAMPRDERRVFYAALLLLPALHGALIFVTTHRVHRILRRLGGQEVPVSHASVDHASRLARTVALAARHGVATGECLPRALATWWLLRQHGVASDIKFGARKDADRFFAHAWVEVQGRPLDESDEDVRRYTIMPWAPADHGL
jgi:hypothetical protein